MDAWKVITWNYKFFYNFNQNVKLIIISACTLHCKYVHKTRTSENIHVIESTDIPSDSFDRLLNCISRSAEQILSSKHDYGLVQKLSKYSWHYYFSWLWPYFYYWSDLRTYTRFLKGRNNMNCVALQVLLLLSYVSCGGFLRGLIWKTITF